MSNATTAEKAAEGGSDCNPSPPLGPSHPADTEAPDGRYNFADLLRGVPAIAEHLRWTRRACYYAIEKGRLPAFQLAALDEHFRDLEQGGGKA
jgi:hypothetical protein